MEELRCRIRVTETRRACGPGLGRSGVTKREQRWAERRRAGQHDDSTGGVQSECRRERRHDEGRRERAQIWYRRWKALLAWAVRTHLSETT
ncbi:hypothetical protein NDU88_006408 [Pleurodeles waltl]|uniref:Uncharacterized protein n=1 Tax=Pleurodeles waltl TaxID=8319 RepID=A0AAV7RR49_PLEWA|nr:hypothetical protein NDU88_006408 [Pleurodeles waltl]